MSAKKWAVLDEVGGTLNAELIKGLLEAQGKAALDSTLCLPYLTRLNK